MEKRVCRFCGGEALPISRKEGRICMPCKLKREMERRKEKNREKNGYDYARMYTCEFCGHKTKYYHVCETCMKEQSVKMKCSASCFNCNAAKTCKSKDNRKQEPCRICGELDSCNEVRNGMCLLCFAKKWNRKHPTSFRIPTVKTLIDKRGE